MNKIEVLSNTNFSQPQLVKRLWSSSLTKLFSLTNLCIIKPYFCTQYMKYISMFSSTNSVSVMLS